jgi:hypothetical protein
MAPPKESEPALAAPGVEGLLATPKPSLTGPREFRRYRDRPLGHVHLELDLAPKPKDPTGVGPLEKLEGFLKERKVTERGTMIRLAGATLHAFASRGFRRVDHWEVTPGGWLPPPGARKDSKAAEPVGELMDVLKSGAMASVASARSFSARLSDPPGDRADVTIRRVHRERRHSLTVDLWGSWTKATVEDLEGSISERLPVVRSTVTKFRFE